jgi:hypothetical protein
MKMLAIIVEIIIVNKTNLFIWIPRKNIPLSTELN